MLNSINTKSNRNLYLGIIFLFLLLKYIEISLVYIFNGDGPWSLSQTLSMLNGDWGWSVFAHEPDGPVYKNYSYAILPYLPFKLFGVSHFSYLSAYFFYILLTIAGVYKIFEKNSFLQFFVSMLFVSSVYTYNFRFEAYAIMLIVWGLFFMFKKSWWTYLGLFFFAWAALIHPATFVALFFILVHYLYLEKKLFDIRTGVIYLLAFSFFALLLLGFDINNLLDPIFVRPELKQRFLVIKPMNVIKWFVLAGVFIWGFIITWRKTTWVSYLIIVINIIVYLLFKKSYYYPYLFLHVILLIYYNKEAIQFNHWLKKAFYLHLIAFGMLFFVFPVYKSVDNPEYGNMMRSNEKYMKKVSAAVKGNDRIYVEKELLMGVADCKNARLYLSEYRNYYNGSPKIDLKGNDKIYIFRLKELNDFKEKTSDIVYQKNVVIREIHKPVSGLLTFDGRGGEIGLWEISLK